jgi:ketosteroid isomerase-like protein
MDAAALADRFFAAIEAGDMDAVAAFYDDRTVVWHNNDGIEQPTAANLATLGWIVANLTDRSYDEIRRQTTDTGFVQQHVMRCTNRRGERVEIPACIVATVDGEIITRIDEYLDSAVIPKLTA